MSCDCVLDSYLFQCHKSKSGQYIATVWFAEVLK